MVQYILDDSGYLTGSSEGVILHNNSTTIPPVYVSGKTPRFLNGTWVDNLKLTPIEFKMCFTSVERIAITTLKATDAIIADAFLILDDPRLTIVNLSLASNIALIDYLATKIPALTPQRVLDIKAGKMI